MTAKQLNSTSVLTVFLIAFGVNYHANAAQNPPNMVILIADDHSQLDCEPYGSKEVRTPFLQKLADSGICFDRAFVNSPSCAPSRASLLTGLSPAHNGAEPNHSRPRKELLKLPQKLKSLGYEVVAFGKVSHYLHTGDYGFDHFAFDSFQDHRGINAAREWLENRNSTKPLALFVGSNWPHVPWPPAKGYDPVNVTIPKSHIDTPEMRDARTTYLTAVTAMDEELGSVYQTAMQKLGESNTVVLFTSDHGAQLPFGKWNLYDQGIKVPLIVKWPGFIKSGSRTSAMVQWMDIMPTLIEIAGGNAVDSLDGRSFLNVLKNPENSHHPAIFTTHSGDNNMNVYPMRSIRTNDWKLIWNLHPEFQFTTQIDRSDEAPSRRYWQSWERAAKRDSALQPIIDKYHVRPEYELYDLRNDPDELVNLAGKPAHSAIELELKQKLEAQMTAQGDERKVFGKPLKVGEKIPLIKKAPAKKKAASSQ